MAEKKSKYSQIIENIFTDFYKKGMTEVPFSREHISEYAERLGIKTPKNLGDVVYSFRYRASLPQKIQDTAPDGKEWLIVGTGSANYCFRLSNIVNILPNPAQEVISLPDNTPEVISYYQLSDEQSLLCKIRYNRIIDTFLGIVTYSMQNHLRTQVKGVGQIEIDEIYIGVNKMGQHFILPVEAKVGRDRIGAVQLMQDIKYCEQNFPDLICIPIGVHKMDDDVLCIFRLKIEDEQVRIVDEKHYRLVHSKDINADDVALRNKMFTY